MTFNNVYLNYVILVVVTFSVVAFISYSLRKILDLVIRRNSVQLHVDPTNFIFLKNAIPFVLYSFAIFWIFQKIPYFKSLGTALFAGAGVLAAIIGFASQKAFSNIIGGLFILMFKPFRVDDIIEISNNRKGIIEEITLRHTIIKDYENRRIVIPNSQISEETIINSSITDNRIRKHLEVGIAYDANIDQAMKIIQEVVESHPLFTDNRTKLEIRQKKDKVEVKVVELGDYAVTLRAYIWSRGNDDAFMLQCDSLKAIKERFDEADVEIPFPYRTIVYKKDM